MIDVLRPYTDYQDSEVSWLGQIPDHWERAHGGAVLQQKKMRNRGMVEDTVLSLSYGRIVIKPPEKLHGLVPESFETYQIVDPGDIIIRPTDLQNDWTTIRVAIARDRGIITSAYLCFRVRKPLTPEYAHLLLLGYDLKKVFYGMGSGLRQNLDWSDFKRLPVLVPPPEEQQAIVQYVAWLDRQVRRFIRNRRLLIEVLNEQKQAVINRAVTRGLDPDVSLKSSGIDWLEDIPEHWEVKSLRQLGRFMKGSGGSREDDMPEGIPCIRYGHLYMYFNFTVSSVRTYISESRAPEYARIKYGDILFTASGEDMFEIGKSVANLIEEEVCCGGDVIILRPRIDAHPAFLGYATDTWQARCQKSRLGRGTTVKHIYGDQLKKVCIAVPPKAEQVAIAEYIQQATSEATALIERAEQEIELIREYRTRLIADVVTGKVDVRHLAPPPGSENLQEAVEELEPLDEAAGELEEEALAGEVAHADD